MATPLRRRLAARTPRLHQRLRPEFQAQQHGALGALHAAEPSGAADRGRRPPACSSIPRARASSTASSPARPRAASSKPPGAHSLRAAERRVHRLHSRIRGAVDAVAALASVRTIEGAEICETNLDNGVPSTNASLFRGPGPAFTGLNGAGVIVGDVDTGADYKHDNFKDAGGLTRFLRIWDETDAIGPAVRRRMAPSGCRPTSTA